MRARVTKHVLWLGFADSPGAALFSSAAQPLISASHDDTMPAFHAPRLDTP